MAFRRVSISTRLFEKRPSVVVWVQGRPILVSRVDGELYAMDAVCAHVGCAILTETEGHVVTCSAHRARFDVRTGEIVEPARFFPDHPCDQENLKAPLRTYPIKEDEGLLAIDI